MMTLITLVLCLSVERFLCRGHWLGRFDWFEQYVCKLYPCTQNQWWTRQRYVVLLFILLPVVIPAVLAYGLSVFFVHGLLTFLLGAGILFYCLGPVSRDDAAALRQPLFWRANANLFAVIFWFAILGPIAALVYRFVERSASLHAPADQNLSKTAGLVLAILDWLPSRVLAILFALAGNFVRTSQCCLDYVFRDVSLNCELLEASGRIALDLEETEALTVAHLPQALKLIDRSLILFLIFTFAVTLGMLC